ncbi:DUF7144 family membrane protein [Georgenia yuyongxinii]|nr:hypothetical protein [Georgenia yuyongxinii]
METGARDDRPDDVNPRNRRRAAAAQRLGRRVHLARRGADDLGLRVQALTVSSSSRRTVLRRETQLHPPDGNHPPGLGHHLLGLLDVAAGVAVLNGKTWGRVVAIIPAVLRALANFAFIPYNPF